MLIKFSPLKSLVLLVLVDVLAILLSSLGGEPLAAVAMTLTSLAGFQSSRGVAWRGAARRGMADRRVNQVAFNLVEKLHGPALIIIMSSFHSV